MKRKTLDFALYHALLSLNHSGREGAMGEWQDQAAYSEVALAFEQSALKKPKPGSFEKLESKIHKEEAAHFNRANGMQKANLKRLPLRKIITVTIIETRNPVI